MLVVGKPHVGLWTTVYLGVALVAGCCVYVFTALGGERREPPQPGR